MTRNSLPRQNMGSHACTYCRNMVPSNTQPRRLQSLVSDLVWVLECQ